MPKSRFQQQKTMQKKDQIQPKRLEDTHRSAFYWDASLLAPLLAVAFLGAVIGVIHPLWQSTLLGAFLGALIGDVGFIVIVLLVRLIRIININRDEVNVIRNKHQSRLALFWWSVVIFVAAIVGAVFGYIFFPDTLSVFLRILFGALIGSFGLIILISIIINPMGLFVEIIKSLIEEGCGLIFSVLFIGMVGVVSSLLIWHSSLLIMLVEDMLQIQVHSKNLL